MLVKISLRRPVLPNRCKEILKLGLGKRCAPCDGRQRGNKEDSIDEGALALTAIAKRLQESVAGDGRKLVM